MFFFITLGYCAKYAILFAGSKDWSNYRHQADVYYMYGILKSHGFDDDHISMWTYNDIADNELNPYPGKVFHTLNNTNIYPGKEKIDFLGENCSSTKFIRYLKELNTTKDDDLFIFYNDHGSANILSTPVGRPITTYQLGNTIITMSKTHKFRKMFFLVEACNSGCLKDSIVSPNVAVITAAQCSESSYSAINSKWAGAFLSNEFSAYVIREIEMNPTHTINSLFENVHEKMSHSTPTIFGDILDTPISDFIGVGPKSSIRRQALDEEDEKIVHAELYAKPEARERYYQHQKYMKSLTEKMENAINTIVNKVAGQEAPIFMKLHDLPDVRKCYEPVLEEYFTKFGEYNQDTSYLITPLKALCTKYDSKVIIDAIDTTLV